MLYVCMYVCTYKYIMQCIYTCIYINVHMYIKSHANIYIFLGEIKQVAVRRFGPRKSVWLPSLRFYFIKQTWFDYLMIDIILIFSQLATLGVPNNKAYLQSGRSSSLSMILEDLVRCLIYSFRTEWTVRLVDRFYIKFKTSNRINELKFMYLRCLNNVILFEPLNNSFATK